MNRIAVCVARFLWTRRLPLGVACLACAALSAWQLQSLSVSNSLESWYPQDDPELAHYRSFRKLYGNDELVIAAISGNGNFSSDDGLETVAALTDALLEVDGIANVTSLVTIPTSMTAARNRLISDDGKTTAFVLQMMDGESIEAQRAQILGDIRNTLATSGYEPRLAGYGVIFNGLNEASTTGTASLLIYAHSLMVILLAAFFRRAGPVLLILLGVSVASLWTMGLYAAAGEKLNMVTMVLPTLVLVIGIADGVHILRSVARQNHSLPLDERVVRGVARVIGPCSLTTVTTAAGFLALSLSELPVVRALGVFGAIGMIAAWLASLVVCTAGCSWISLQPAPGIQRIDALAARLCHAATRSPRTVIGIFAGLSLVALLGISRLVTDTYSIEYLQSTHPVRLDSDFIESTLGAYTPIEFTLRGQDILQAEKLEAVRRWQSSVTRMQNINWSWSLVDALAPERSLSGTSSQALKDKIERLRRFSPVTLAAMLAGNEELKVSFGAPIMSARAVRELVDEIAASPALPQGLDVRAAGYSPLYTLIVDRLVWSQVVGFGIAMLLILALLGAAFRSWQRSLLALPANIVPLAMTLGVMGLARIPLDVATATIATVILGLVVDDSVHLLRPGAQREIRTSIATTAATAGGTLLMTSVVLAGGFAVLALADIRSVAWFGALASFAMIVAILTDLLLLPALVAVSSRKIAPAANHQVFHSQASAIAQAESAGKRDHLSLDRTHEDDHADH